MSALFFWAWQNLHLTCVCKAEATSSRANQLKNRFQEHERSFSSRQIDISEKNWLFFLVSLSLSSSTIPLFLLIQLIMIHTQKIRLPPSSYSITKLGIAPFQWKYLKSQFKGFFFFVKWEKTLQIWRSKMKLARGVKMPALLRSH